MNIYIRCDDCKSDLMSTDELYCSRCWNTLQDELATAQEEIKELKKTIDEIELEKSTENRAKEEK